VDFGEIDRAIRDIEKQVKGLAEISRWGDKARIIGNRLAAQVEVLDEAVSDLKRSTLPPG